VCGVPAFGQSWVSGGPRRRICRLLTSRGEKLMAKNRFCDGELLDADQERMKSRIAAIAGSRPTRSPNHTPIRLAEPDVPGKLRMDA
jgi:hypothetical protein